jgi:hypothetical protein
MVCRKNVEQPTVYRTSDVRSLTQHLAILHMEALRPFAYCESDFVLLILQTRTSTSDVTCLRITIFLRVVVISPLFIIVTKIHEINREIWGFKSVDAEEPDLIGYFTA